MCPGNIQALKEAFGEGEQLRATQSLENFRISLTSEEVGCLSLSTVRNGA